jgi:hypothetical protein
MIRLDGSEFKDHEKLILEKYSLLLETVKLNDKTKEHAYWAWTTAALNLVFTLLTLINDRKEFDEALAEVRHLVDLFEEDYKK